MLESLKGKAVSRCVELGMPQTEQVVHELVQSAARFGMANLLFIKSLN